MSTLILCAAGPLQSWGIGATHDRRGTTGQPTLSAVVGFLAAAQGLPRAKAASWVPAPGFDMSVRVDRPGVRMTDYHTVNGDPAPGREAITYTGHKHDATIQTYRDYLTDAAFLIALTHPDANLIDRCADAVQNPVWVTALGRRACLPGLPPYLGVVDTDIDLTFWENVPILRKQHQREDTATLTVRSSSRTSDPTDYWDQDTPVAYGTRDRAYDLRAVHIEQVTVPATQCAGTGLNAHHAIRSHLAALTTTRSLA